MRAGVDDDGLDDAACADDEAGVDEDVLNATELDEGRSQSRSENVTVRTPGETTFVQV
jgi:hypothetical protein